MGAKIMDDVTVVCPVCGKKGNAQAYTYLVNEEYLPHSWRMGKLHSLCK